METGLGVQSCEFHDSFGRLVERIRVEWAAIAVVADQLEVMPSCTGLEPAFGLFTLC